MRVLIADDNQDAADTLAMIVRFWGHEVQVAYDGATAITVARQFKPHIILLDIQMPKVNGGEVALRLRRQAGLEGTGILAVSASDPEDDRLACYEGVFDGYLGKPCDLDRLHDILSEQPSYTGCQCRATVGSR
jgi:DNA-binding response OmpR family regulator